MEITFKLNNTSEIAQLRELLNSMNAKAELSNVELSELHNSMNVKAEILNVVENAPIEVLYLPVRSENCLKSVNIKHIGSLVTWSKGQLFKIPNLGRKNIADIEDALKRLGLELPHISKATCETTHMPRHNAEVSGLSN